MRRSPKLERAMRLAEGKRRQEHSVEEGGEPRKGTNVSLVPFSQEFLNSMIVVDLHPGVSYRGSLIDTICRLPFRGVRSLFRPSLPLPPT
jgi:hypothetical protein